MRLSQSKKTWQESVPAPWWDLGSMDVPCMWYMCVCRNWEPLLIPPWQGVLWPHKPGLCYSSAFIKLLPDLGKKLGLSKLGLFLQKLKLKFRSMLLFHLFISLCPNRLQKCLSSFPRADCQCGLQGPISAQCQATALWVHPSCWS